MIIRDGELVTIMQHQEEDEAQKSTEKEQRAKTSTTTGRVLLLVKRVLYLHIFLLSSIPQNLAVASKVTTLAMESTFFFADRLIHLQAVFRVARNIPLWAQGISGLWDVFSATFLFGSPLFNVDNQQINSLMSIFICHCFHFFAIFMLLLLAFLELMLPISDFQALLKIGRE